MNRLNLHSKYDAYLEIDDHYNLDQYLEDLNYEDMLEKHDLKKIKIYIRKQLPLILSANKSDSIQSFTIEHFYRALNLLKKYNLEPEINSFIKKIEKKLSSKLKVIVL